MTRRDDDAEALQGKRLPVREAGGVIWVYLWRAERLSIFFVPEFPEHPWMRWPETSRYIRLMVSHSNFVQVRRRDGSHSSHSGCCTRMPSETGRAMTTRNFGKTETSRTSPRRGAALSS